MRTCYHGLKNFQKGFENNSNQEPPITAVLNFFNVLAIERLHYEQHSVRSRKQKETENKKEQTINFISEAHEKFYYEKLKEVRYQDVYHKALCYCLGINDDTRRNANRIYDFKTGCVKTECLHEGWQTSGSVKVVRMAFNLYCNATPSVDDYTDAEEQINECRQYTVEELFCCAYAPYFWQAIQIRYPEYATYNRKLYALFGGAD